MTLQKKCCLALKYSIEVVMPLRRAVDPKFISSAAAGLGKLRRRPSPSFLAASLASCCARCLARPRGQETDKGC
jgi:hypothetical protein